MSDPVNPAHYCGSLFQCIDAIHEATEGLTGVEGYCTGNAIKYLWRWKKKNGIEDLKKAQWYLNYLIKMHEHAEQQQNNPSLQTGTGGTARTSTPSSEGIQPDGTSTGTNEHSSA